MNIRYFLLRITEPTGPVYEVAFAHKIHAEQTYATTYAKVEDKPPYEIVETTLWIEQGPTHL